MFSDTKVRYGILSSQCGADTVTLVLQGGGGGHTLAQKCGRSSWSTTTALQNGSCQRAILRSLLVRRCDRGPDALDADESRAAQAILGGSDTNFLV